MAQIRVGNEIKTARPVEARCELGSKGLVLDKTIFPCRVNGLLVETLRIKMAASDAGDLCGDQRVTVEEVLMSMALPLTMLLLLCQQHLAIPLLLFGIGLVVMGSKRESGIEVIFRPLERNSHPRRELFTLERRRDGFFMVFA
jgi:hypothetical protein